MFLTNTEIIQLTGVRQKAAQTRWLTRNGLKYFVRADGRAAVPADQISSRKNHRPSGLNLDALDKLS